MLLTFIETVTEPMEDGESQRLISIMLIAGLKLKRIVDYKRPFGFPKSKRKRKDLNRRIVEFDNMMIRRYNLWVKHHPESIKEAIEEWNELSS